MHAALWNAINQYIQVYNYPFVGPTNHDRYLNNQGLFLKHVIVFSHPSEKGFSNKGVLIPFWCRCSYFDASDVEPSVCHRLDSCLLKVTKTKRFNFRRHLQPSRKTMKLRGGGGGANETSTNFTGQIRVPSLADIQMPVWSMTNTHLLLMAQVFRNTCFSHISCRFFFPILKPLTRIYILHTPTHTCVCACVSAFMHRPNWWVFKALL
jgi:hypothetical protein